MTPFYLASINCEICIISVSLSFSVLLGEVGVIVLGHSRQSFGYPCGSSGHSCQRFGYLWKLRSFLSKCWLSLWKFRSFLSKFWLSLEVQVIRIKILIIPESSGHSCQICGYLYRRSGHSCQSFGYLCEKPGHSCQSSAIISRFRKAGIGKMFVGINICLTCTVVSSRQKDRETETSRQM